MRKLALAVAGAALVSAALWLALRSRSSEASVAAPHQAETSGERAETALVLPAGESMRAEAAAEAPPAIAGDVPAAVVRPPAAPETAELVLRGTITVADDTGTEHPNEDGRLVLILWRDTGRGRHGSHLEVPVAAGRWTTSIAADIRTVGANEIELGGRPAALLEQAGDPHVALAIPASRKLDLRARWPDATRLVVRAADTGRGLDAVEVVRIKSWPENDFAHPGTANRTIIEAAARSPVAIPVAGGGASAGRVVLYARAPGYAWGRIEVEPAAGAERLLELSPGGALDVHVVGGRAGPGTRLRLRSAADGAQQPILEVDLTGRELVALDSLPAGTYRVSAELGEHWSDPRVLGMVEAELRVGDRTVAVLSLEPLTAVESAMLSGVVVVPVEWQVEDFNVWVELLDTPLHGQEALNSVRLTSSDRIEGSTDTYPWSAGRVQPGRYEIEMFDLAYSISVEVPPTGRTDVRFEVPPPGMVSVRVIDRATSGDAEIDELHWRCRLPEGTNGGGFANAMRNAETGRWEFRAPQCTVVLSAWGKGYQRAHLELAVGPGTTEATLELERASSLLVILKDGESSVPLDQSSDMKVEPVEGDGRVSGWGRSARGARISVSVPGRYRVRVPAPAGYMPIQEREVELEVGREVELVIQLERKP